MLMFRRIVTLVVILAQLVSCAPGQGGFQMPGGGFPSIPGLPGGFNIPLPQGTGGALSPVLGQVQPLVIQALYTQIGHILGDDLPVKLDAKTAYAKVAPPQNFNPTPIECTPDNVNTPLQPGDYTCQVVLYCMKDSLHRNGRGTPYEFGPLQGKQADAIGTLLSRGAAANTPPQTLQTISWEIQASIPVSQMPAQHQQVVHQLIPEYEQGLQGDFLQQIEATYNSFRSAGLPPLDTVLGQMGDAGRTIQSIRRSRQIIRQNALNYERLDQQVYDGPPGQRTVTPAVPQPSPWSQIDPRVIAQLVIQQGNLGLNTLNFRVLPPAATDVGSNQGQARVINAAFINEGSTKLALSATETGLLLTLGSVFFTYATIQSQPAIRKAVQQIAYPQANSGTAGQAVTMSMNNNQNNGGQNSDACKKFKEGRAAYEAEVRNLRKVATQFGNDGLSDEEIASRVSAMRRQIGEKYKDLTPEPFRSRILKRNIQQYGDELGPKFEYLKDRKSFGDIIDSATRPGGEDIIPDIINYLCGGKK